MKTCSSLDHQTTGQLQIDHRTCRNTSKSDKNPERGDRADKVVSGIQGGSLLSRVRRTTASVAIVFSVILTTCLLGSSPASAFTGGGAASYADHWATTRNSNYPSFSEDCTNFVSQALHDSLGGQKPYVNNGADSTSVNNWWAQYSSIFGFSNSQTWSVADSFYNFMNFHGGVVAGRAGPNQSEQLATYTPANVVTGDILFYDWENNGSMDHVGIQVGIGNDPSAGLYGNYSDQHTNDHYHAFWSLLPYNEHWPTTAIVMMHVSS
jgi:hypothetical protein